MDTTSLPQTLPSITQSGEATSQASNASSSNVSPLPFSGSKKVLITYNIPEDRFAAKEILPTEIWARVAENLLENLKDAIYKNSDPKTWPKAIFSFKLTCLLFRKLIPQNDNFFVNLAQKLQQEDICWGGEDEPANLLEATLEVLKMKGFFESETLLDCLNLLDKQTFLQDKIKKTNIAINVKDRENKTLLHWAAISGHVKLVKALLEAKADVNAKGCAFGATPLHDAIEYGHIETVQVLLDAGADPNAKAHSGWRPLHYAAMNGHTKVAQVLLAANGIEVNAKNDYGKTALDLALEYQNFEVAALLKSAMNFFERRVYLRGVCRKFRL